MTHTTTRHRLRSSLVLLTVLAAAGAAFALTRKEATPTVAATIFKTATVTAGSLTTTESIDGSLLLSETTSVLHRIEGQTASTSSTGGGASGGTGGAPAAGLTTSAAGLVATAATPTEAVAADTCTTPGDTTTTTTTTTTVDSGGSTTTDATTTSTSTTSTTVPTVPVTDPVGTTTSPTPTTTPCTTTPATTVGGGAPSGGGAGSTGTGGTTSTGGTSTSGSARVTQVVTSVIDVGAEVEMGTVLYSVESHPVVALAGSLPAWRSLDADSEDGNDILQLEMNLVALGYDPDGTMTVDATYDSDTTAVVEAWQAGYGMEVTGAVALGSVVFVPTSTVSQVDVSVGDEVGEGDEVLALSSSSQQVVIDVPDGDEAALVPGLVVKIGGGEGTVTLLRSITRDGSVVVQAVITPSAPVEGVGNGQAITVTVTLGNLDGVLTVPAEALVSRIDGSYALQVVGADGTTSFVDVELLGIAGSQVAVRGEGLSDGTEVLQPL
jgi:hypothetical protein